MYICMYNIIFRERLNSIVVLMSSCITELMEEKNIELGSHKSTKAIIQHMQTFQHTHVAFIICMLQL